MVTTTRTIGSQGPGAPDITTDNMVLGNPLRGRGNPNGRYPGRLGMSYIDEDSGTEWLKLTNDLEKTGWAAESLVEVVNVKDKEFGAVGDGVTNDSEAFSRAKAAAIGGSGKMYVPHGTYILDGITHDGRISLVGESVRGTVLKASGNGVTVLTVDTPNSDDKEWGTYSDFRIDGGGYPNSVGMKVGSDVHTGNSSNTFKRIHITNCGLDGLVVLDATACLFEKIYIDDCGRYGIYIPNERNTQVCDWVSCRVRQCHTGLYAASGNRYSWTSCNFESNRNRNIYFLRQNSSGPSNSIFIACWLENGGHDRTTVSSGSGDNIIPAIAATDIASIYFDANSGIQTTTNYNLIFICCQVSGAFSGVTRLAWDIIADRGEALFDRCTFGESTGVYDSGAFKYSTGTGGSVHILFRQCGKLNAKPSLAMHANIPAPTILAGQSTRASYGIFYEFEDNGRTYSNRRLFGYNGTPVGVLTPAYDGEVVIDTSVTPNVRYVANGITSSDWITIEGSISGAFTPTIFGSSAAGAATYTVALGRYSKVGRMVTVSGRVAWTGHTGTGDMNIGGLPYAAENAPGIAFPAFILAQSITYSNSIAGHITSTDTSIAIRTYSSAGSAGVVAMSAAGTIDFSVTYRST